MADDPPEESGSASRRYEVGYGRPPHHSRFQTGQSGNRKGRPSRSKNMATLLAKALNERVGVTENGRRRTITKREAIIAQLVNRSAAADLRAMAMLMGMLQHIETSAGPHTPEPENLAEADERVLQSLRERLTREGDGE